MGTETDQDLRPEDLDMDVEKIDPSGIGGLDSDTNPIELDDIDLDPE